MSSAGGLIRHLRNYASAGVLSAVVGVVSFPILTRNLSIEEYGILGLITSSLTLFIAVGKLGVQQSVIRWYAAVKAGNSEFSSRQMYATVVVLFLCLALATFSAWLFAGYAILPNVLQYERITTLFFAASGVVFVRLLGSAAINFLRADQRSAEVAQSQVLARLVNLSLIVLFVIFSDIDPRLLLWCLLFAEIVGMGFAASRCRESISIEWKAFSRPLATALLTYGLPLMMLESLGLVMRLSDRYLIEGMMGVSALGQYSASYNLVGYLDIIVLAALIQALRPMYMQLFENEGIESTRRFLSSGFHCYLVLGIPFVAIFSLVSPHALAFLAGDRYAPGTVVIPFITFSFLIEGTINFLAAGLYINRNTRVLMIWSCIAVVINLALNVAVIPVFGLVGAASVTIVSYLVFLGGISRASFREFSFPLFWRIPLAMCVVSFLVWLVVGQIDSGNHILDGFIKGLISSVALGAIVLTIERDYRQWLMAKLRRVFGVGSAEAAP